jgi:hypothetical protein
VFLDWYTNVLGWYTIILGMVYYLYWTGTLEFLDW